MCGIFGCVSLFGKKPNIKSINLAVKSLSHRGPDDSGIEKFDNVILGHTRLSIIDLKTKAAEQPVVSPTSLLAFNGMIYNFKELQKILSKNNMFKGNSDTEVLAKCLNQWGIKKTLKNIDGMFAFVWFCKKKREIYLVRDPMGEKPLYWAKKNNLIYFSSEMKSFFEIKEFSKKPNIDLMDDYFYTQKISGSKTIYSEINEVEPGTVIKISTLTGSISSTSYFSLENTFNKEVLTSNKIDELNNIFEEIIFSRTISDVPLGCLVSGGIDSSVILSYMMQNDNISRVNTYFADVKNQNRSEFESANMMANFLKKKYKQKKLNLNSKKNNLSQYINLLIKTTKFFDEPVHFGNSPDLLNVVNQASKDGIKVLLSGEGSDEIFFGYDRMVRAYEFSKKNKSKKLLMEELYFGGGKHNIDFVKKLCEPIKKGKAFSPSWLWLEKNVNKYPIDDLILMFSQKFRLQALLQRQDRVGMLCGLEIRVPFLSKKLVKFANSLEFKDKFIKKTNTTKLILKLMAKEKQLVPNQIINKQKIGFNSDITDWLNEDRIRIFLKDMINDKKGFFNAYLDGKSAKQIFNIHFEGKKRLDTLVWSMFALEIWHRACGEGEISFFKNYE
jgi:asparagine synthase (glutamine-hydrolysing)